MFRVLRRIGGLAQRDGVLAVNLGVHALGGQFSAALILQHPLCSLLRFLLRREQT